MERTGGDEELRSVGVLSCVGHGEETRLGVLQLEVLIWIGEPFRRRSEPNTPMYRSWEIFAQRTSELLAVDGLSTSSVAY